MVYWEFLVTGKLEFTQFDPLVAEKHLGLQGLKWEGYSIKRVENKLNWIISLTKPDIIGIRIGLDYSYRRFAVIANSRPPTFSFAIGRRFRNQIGYRTRFLDSLYKVRVSINPYLFFCLWALFPFCGSQTVVKKI